MSVVRFDMDKGWKKWERAVGKKVFRSKLRKHLKQATFFNQKIAEASIRKEIKRGSFEANSPLTIMIKGSSKPLVDKGTGLFQAITSKRVDDLTAFAGVLRTSEKYNIALGLHEGMTIRVTPAMRGMFFMLWKASEGEIGAGELTGRAAELWDRAPGGWKPLRSTTTQIIIPARPFIRQAFDNAELRRRAKRNWENAVQKTIKELAQG